MNKLHIYVSSQLWCKIETQIFINSWQRIIKQWHWSVNWDFYCDLCWVAIHLHYSTFDTFGFCFFGMRRMLFFGTFLWPRPQKQSWRLNSLSSRSGFSLSGFLKDFPGKSLLWGLPSKRWRSWSQDSNFTCHDFGARIPRLPINPAVGHVK